MIRKIVFLLAAFLCGACFSAWAKGRSEAADRPAAEDQPEMQVAAMKGPTGIGMIKLFEDAPAPGGGIRARYTAYSSPDLVVPKMVRGEIDIAALPANLAVNLYNRGAPYRLVGIIGNGVLYLVTTDPDVSSLESLKGKTVQNVARGSTPEFVARHILEKKGLAKDVDVQFRYAHAELAQLLIAGREASGILPEPFASKVLLAKQGSRIACDFQEEWAALHPARPLYPMTVLVAKASLPGSVLAAFTREYRKSQDWVTANPGEAGVLAEKFEFGISAADAVTAIPRCNLVFVQAAQARPLLEEFLSVFLEFAPEAIGGKLPDDGFYPAP
ncbi:MAG: ABC transporter substrate-binding protein [Spirochaetales bacterium]|jgi:NitT/TauT family transport system substrate-binding protein|nr:ABC transporter substrate-binding protein [Spirochaetales bacterium]